MGWESQHIETLQQCVENGLSAAQTARILGDGFTRNSTLAKAWRMGLVFHSSAPQNSQPPRKKREPKTIPLQITMSKTSKQSITVTCMEPLSIQPASPTDGRVTLRILQPNQCHFPIDDGELGEFSYCGAFAEGTYCEAHDAVMFDLKKPSRR